MKKFISAIQNFLISMEIYIESHYLEVVVEKILIFFGSALGLSVLMFGYSKHKIGKLSLRDFVLKVVLALAIAIFVFLFVEFGSFGDFMLTILLFALTVLFGKALQASLPKNS